MAFSRDKVKNDLKKAIYKAIAKAYKQNIPFVKQAVDGVGPEQLNIEGLITRIEKESTEEILFALNPTIQGDTTIYYIQKKIAPLGCKVTTIARGIAFGGELEYADEMTLARSITNRLPVGQYVK